MKRFSVYIPQDNNLEKAVFIKEGFSLTAFVLTILWTLYNKLFFVSLTILSTVLLIEILFQGDYVSNFTVIIANFVGIPLFCGFNASSWLQNSLLKSNFEFAGMVIAENLTKAQIKFFSEYNLVDKKYKTSSSC